MPGDVRAVLVLHSMHGHSSHGDTHPAPLALKLDSWLDQFGASPEEPRS